MGKSGRIWLTMLLAVAMVGGQLPSYLLGSTGTANAAGGTISGTVHDASGAVLQGIKVRLDQVGAGPSPTLTDSAGTYTFTGLPDGDYYAVFDPGPTAPVIVYNQARSTATGTVISVRNGDSHPGIDATFLSSGQFTTLSGFVRNPGGQIQGIDVSLYIAADGNANSCCYFVRSVTTNSAGFYSMAIAYGASYKVRFAGGTPLEQWWNAKGNPGNNTLSGWTGATPIFPDGAMTADATLGVLGTISGTAACTIGATTLVANGVVLLSGGIVVDELRALTAGAFSFTGAAPNSKYTLVYFGSFFSSFAVEVGTPFHCSVDVTTDQFGNATAGPGVDPRAVDLKNHSFPTAPPPNGKGGFGPTCGAKGGMNPNAGSPTSKNAEAPGASVQP